MIRRRCEGGDLKSSKPDAKTSPEIARDPEERAAVAIEVPTDRATVLAGTGPAKQEPADPDAALRAAIRAALDAGDDARAEALMAILRSTPKIAPVLTLAVAKKK